MVSRHGVVMSSRETGAAGRENGSRCQSSKSYAWYPTHSAALVKGFGRRPLAGGGARHGEAGVRKPPKEETAFRKRRWRRSHDLWGFEERSLSAARS